MFSLILYTTLFASTSASLYAQTIPPAAPTTAPAAPAPHAAPSPPPVRRAQVDFANQLLTVSADNSSLNQILRDISQRTGMTITGGVTDERVFGTYGPADPSTVLSALLNGTGSNMLLVLDDAKSPHELILTPRQGGPTPPSPNSYRGDNENFNGLSPQRNPRFGKQGAQQFAPPPPPQQEAQPQPPSQPPAVTTPATSTTDPSSTTTQQSPNGVKTPQQIYDQLLKMQQKPTTPPQ